MTIYNSRRKRGAHPGWAVRLGDGSWITSGHGLFPDESAQIASINDTKEEAEALLKYFAEDWHDPALIEKAEIVPAWEPLCESLKSEIAQLKAALKITPDQLEEVIEKLEEAKYILSEASYFRRKDQNAEPTVGEETS